MIKKETLNQFIMKIQFKNVIKLKYENRVKKLKQI